jgi:hypothetical protein
MSTTQTLFEPEGRPMRRSDETYAAWQARLEAWRRGHTGGDAEVSRTLISPAVGMPPVSLRFAPSATGERLGDFEVTGTADLPAPQVASSASGMPSTETTSGTPAPSRSPQPWPSASFGGSVAPGLRAPPTMEGQLAWAPRRPVLEATGFDPAWGTPPEVRGLRWSPMRFLYEPAPDETGAPYRRPADRGYYRQPHQSPVLGSGRWGWRWIEVESTVPDPTRPYRVLGTAEASALDVEVNRASLGRRLLAPEGGKIERKLDLREPARNWIPPSTPAPAITRRPRMTDFAWIPQKDLPVGCPYPHAHLPVPRQDYVSGRWLSPDYVPSIPLPAPYDQTPWQCGVPAVEQTRKGRGGPDAPPLSEQIVRRQDAPPPSWGPAEQTANLEVGLPPPTGSAAPAQPAPGGDAPAESNEEDALLLARQELKAIQQREEEIKEKLRNASPAEQSSLKAELEKIRAEGLKLAERLNDATHATDTSGSYVERKAQAPGIPPPNLVAAPQDSAPGAPPGPRREPCNELGPDGRRIRDGSGPRDGVPAVEDTDLFGNPIPTLDSAPGLRRSRPGEGPGPAPGRPHSLESLARTTHGGMYPHPPEALLGGSIVDDITNGRGNYVNLDPMTRRARLEGPRVRPIEVVGNVWKTTEFIGNEMDLSGEIYSWGTATSTQQLTPRITKGKGNEVVIRDAGAEGEPLTQGMWFGVAGKGHYGFIQYVEKSLECNFGDGNLEALPMRGNEGPMHVDVEPTLPDGGADWYQNQAASQKNGVAMMFDAPGVGLRKGMADLEPFTVAEIQKLFHNNLLMSDVAGAKKKGWSERIGAQGSIRFTQTFKTLVVRLDSTDCKQRIRGYWDWEVVVTYDPKQKWAVELSQPPAFRFGVPR